MPQAALIISSTHVSQKLVDQVYSEGYGEILIATDSTLDHEKYKNDARIQDVIFPDQMVSIYAVREKAFRIRANINQWMHEQAPKVSEYLISFIKHAEGGISTQKIVDAVILSESLKRIFTAYGIEKMYIQRNAEDIFFDQVCIQTALASNIAVSQEKSFRFRLLDKFQSKRFEKTVFNCKVAVVLPFGIGILVKKAIFLAKIYRIHGKKDLETARAMCSHKKVLFIAEGDNEKATNPLVPVMREFDATRGFASLLLLWNGKKSCQRMIRNNIRSVNLESFFSISSLIELVRQSRYIKKSIESRIHQILNNELFVLDGINYGIPLKSYILEFVNYDVTKRIVMREALKEFYKYCYPDIFKSRGDFRLDFDIVCYNVLKEMTNDDRPFPYVFSFQSSYGDDSLFGDPEIDAINLYFVLGESEKKSNDKQFKQTETILGSRVARPGSEYSEFKNTTRKDSMETLGLENERTNTIVYFSSNCVAGIFSSRESALILKTLINYVKNDSRTQLIIKPHPSENVSLIKLMQKECGNPQNVICLSRTSPLIHALNICDVAIMKISTVGIEAMEFGKPVIIFSMDNEERFLQYWDGSGDIYMDPDSLMGRLNEIFATQDSYARWKEAKLIQQREFLGKAMFAIKGPFGKYVVENVLERLK